MNGATFRRHYLKSKQDANKNDPPREVSRAAVLDTGPSPLCESLAKIPEPSIPILLAWFQEHGIWIHESLEIREMSDRGGIAVFAVGAGAPQQVGEVHHVSISILCMLTHDPKSMQDSPLGNPLSAHSSPCRPPPAKDCVPDPSDRPPRSVITVRAPPGARIPVLGLPAESSEAVCADCGALGSRRWRGGEACEGFVLRNGD